MGGIQFILTDGVYVASMKNMIFLPGRAFLLTEEFLHWYRTLISRITCCAIGKESELRYLIGKDFK